MLRSVILKRLKDVEYLTKDKCLEFDFFELFPIGKSYFEKRAFEETFVLESKGKKFEYWISQDLFIPPWETHWFQLKDNFLLKLKENLLSNLISRALKNAGNLNKLCKEIKMSSPTFYNSINEKKIQMISVLKLRKLLNYINIKYSSIDKKIEYTKKGNKISINFPKFPIKFNNSFGAQLLGMIVSDGCIYIDKKARNCIRTKYSSGEKESINKFVKIINQTYGLTFIQKERIRNCDILKIGSSIIGDSLLKVGAILGHKARKDEGIPWLIKLGNKELKRSYLKAVFEDEGSLWDKRYGYIILSRSKHIKNITEKQREELVKLEKYMSKRRFPTGHINKSISIKKAIKDIKDKKLINLLSNNPPKLLKEESLLLRKFSINNRLWPRILNKTSLGRYSLTYDLFISQKESILKFYKEIGFSLKRKQKKLLNLIKNLGGQTSVKTL